MAKLIHYRDKCIGCGICQERQPDVWRMSRKDGKATLLQGVQKKGIFIQTLHPAQVAFAEETAVACPVNIIKVV